MPAPPSPNHWDEFYKNPHVEEVTEYMLPYSAIAAYLTADFLRIRANETRVLVVGCGMSALGEELHDAYAGQLQEVVNVDVNAYCVEQLRQRNKIRPRMSFYVEDVSRSSFPASSFGLVVDKGVLDDILALPRPEGCSPSHGDAGERAACEMVWEVRRLLAGGGVYVVASALGPTHVQPLLDPSLLGFASVEHFPLDRTGPGHHVYVCRLAAAPPGPGDGAGFERYVAEVTRSKYTEAMPLLTPRRAGAVRAAFDRAPAGRLSARAVHDHVFTAEERREYELDDFLDDLATFLLMDREKVGLDHLLSLDTTLAFLSAMQ